MKDCEIDARDYGLKFDGIKPSLMLKKINNLVFALLVLFWILFVISEYLAHHRYFYIAFFQLAYYDLLICIGVLSLIFVALISKPRWFKLEFHQLKLNGLKIVFYLLLLAVLALTVFGLKIDLFKEYNYVFSLFNMIRKYLFFVFGLYFVSLSFYICGHKILEMLRIKFDGIQKNLYSIAVGIVFFVTLMMIIGSFGLLKYYVLWPIFLLNLILNYKEAFKFFKVTLIQPIELKTKIDIRHVLLATILLTVISFNIIDLLRPIPINWDDLRLYMNIPQLMYQSGNLVSGGMAYNWSILMSLGFLLFHSPEIAMGISFLGGILSLFALFAFARRFLNPIYSILLLVVFYTLPSIVFLSTLAMKIDLGLLFLSLVTLDLFFEWVAEKRADNPTETTQNLKIIALIGLLCGFVFGVKYTSLMLIIAILCLFAYQYLRLPGFIITFGASLLAVFQLRLYEKSGIQFSLSTQMNMKFFCFSLVLGALVFAVLKVNYRKSIIILFKVLVILSIFCFIGFSPWLIKNYSETKRIDIGSLLGGKSLAPQFNLAQINELYRQKYESNSQIPDHGSDQLERESKNIQIISTGAQESIQVLFGYEAMALRYLTLPFDFIINTKVLERLVDIGFLLLILPISVLLLLRKRFPTLATSVLLILTLAFLLVSFFTSVIIVHCDQNNLSIECVENVLKYSQKPISEPFRFLYNVPLVLSPFLSLTHGLFAKVPESIAVITALLIFSMPLMAIGLLTPHQTNLKFLLSFLAAYLLLWLLLSPGIFWYGMIGFVVLFLLFLVIFKTDFPGKFERLINKFMVFIVVIWIAIAFILRFLTNAADPKALFNRGSVRFATGEYESLDSLWKGKHIVAVTVERLNKDPESLIYMIGTVIPYFIHNNMSRLLNDEYLDLFNRIQDSSQTKEEIAQKMNLAGFKYIVVDLEIPLRDGTPEKTLTQKFDSFMNFVKNNPKIKVLITDRTVRNENGHIRLKVNGQIVRGSRGLEGDILFHGNLAVFEILE